MRINRDLNLVIPLKLEEGEFFIHSTPISSETFRQYFLVLSKVLNQIHAEGLHVVGPRIASMLLQRIAEEGDPENIPSGWLGNADSWSGRFGVKNGLFNEIRRLSNVIMPTENGWQSVPLYDVIKQELIPQQKIEEVESLIVFFTCVWHIHSREEMEKFLVLSEKAWNTRTSSLTCTEYLDSLPTSTATEIFVPTVKQSSIPG